MSRYNGGWPRYVPVAERRRKAEREMEKLRKKGHSAAAVRIEGRIIAATFWGKAWCDNLESYGDYESRLPRGRTYVRNGSVLDLQIAPREVKAMVSGSSIYRVVISIGAVSNGQWQSMCADCGNGIDSLVELLQGRLSNGVMERLCHQDKGLFPKPSDIRFTCSCPDHASMCKHVAAVLYGVGARLDQQPELLFRLRAVNENDLVTNIGRVLPLSQKSPATGRILEVDDASALFGLDLVGVDTAGEAGEGISPAPPLPDEPRPSRVSGKAATKKGVAGRKISRRRAARKEGTAPKQGAAPRPPRAPESPAQVSSSTADKEPEPRRANVAGATSGGIRDRPTAAREKSRGAGTKVSKASAARRPKTSIVSRAVMRTSRPTGSVVSKRGEATVKPGRQALRKPASVVGAVIGVAKGESSGKSRRNGASSVRREPQPVKWWLPSYKAQQ